MEKEKRGVGGPVTGAEEIITAVILAGGMGTRLRPVVSDRPKILAEIHGRPFITFILDQIAMVGGISDVILCTGYMADAVRSTLGNTYKELNILYSEEKSPLGTGGALRHSLPKIRSKYALIMNGDSYTECNLEEYVQWFFEQDIKASLLITEVEDGDRFGKVEIAHNGMVRAFREKEVGLGGGWINAGVYILKTSLINTIPEGVPYSIEQDFFPKLTEGILYGYRVQSPFLDIGTPESFAMAGDFFKLFNN